MKISGFNGFGQFGQQLNPCITQFAELKVETKTNKADPQLIAASWNYLACAWGTELLLQGFLSEAPNQQLIVNAPANISCISACDKFCLVLTADGKVYKVLPKLDAQLEEIKLNVEQRLNLPQKRNLFGVSKDAVELEVTHIACGTTFAVAITTSNCVFSIPTQVHQFEAPFRCKQLVCGFEHALLLNSNGDVYSWGNGLRGQLGQEVIISNQESPLLVEALAGIKINFIAAGGWHSAAISAFGDLYTWGFNSNGQMGLRVFKSDGDIKNPSVYSLPQIIELPLECCAEHIDSNSMSLCSAAKVFAGARHTLVLMTCGTLYAMGWNEHGQLSLEQNDKEQIDVLEKVEVGVIDVVCGSWCTIVKKQ